MKSILISGGTGLIGSKLLESLNRSKYKIYVLTRKRSFIKNDVHYINWNPENLELKEWLELFNTYMKTERFKDF